MSPSEKYNDQLDRYFRSEMGVQEEKDFLAEVDTNADLKALFDQHNDIVKAVELSSLKELKEKLVEKEKESAPVEEKKTTPFYYKIAAGLALIAVASWILVSQLNNTVDTNQLFTAYYEPYPNVVDPIDRSSVIDNGNPYGLFELKEYQKSLEVLNKMPETDTTNFYKGQIYMAIDQNRSAIDTFSKIRSSSNFSDAAHWYLSLAYLASGEIKQAETLLTEIIQEEGPYSQRANDLLDKL